MKVFAKMVAIVALSIASPATAADSEFCSHASEQMRSLAASGHELIDQVLASLPDDVEKIVSDGGGVKALLDPSFRDRLAEYLSPEQDGSKVSALKDYLETTAELIVPLQQFANQADIAAGDFDRCRQ